ncbi:MAG: hypothetical protein KME49_15935 [Brasilonema octagenarum HA4186-MV1]|jgi:hypothetical protein|uniref:Uncharacterized protein n=2 Tax=Brasilonema TaxID=383614 RepID=A0A856MB62_9CYAN|nr:MULTISPECIES: hypothetical protein [Brasilonema]MBW4626945.1 hypothetical protein [Brasilonema octagenarum HA4186-MV1]NMF64522.1 hypothetical protein [Brasilonema octagenarum UFV-OR1]QDL07932.1 hypothetical protein DP114_08455 [Brasilonema sennae CENA114]QDL14292.1 hypothetical protein DP113_08410 [Brasilonema octagenarum UFV-E1]
MVTVVVVINILISLILLYVAWRVRRLKRRLTRIANIFIAAERSSHAVLYTAPQAFYTSLGNINNLRHKDQPARLQIQRLRQIFSLVALGQQVWQSNFLSFRAKLVKKRK